MPPRKSIRKLAGYGAGLRERLEAADLTQLELALAAGLSRQTISRAIKSDELSADTERRIDDALRPKAAPVKRTPDERNDRNHRTPAPRLRASNAWVRASDLVDWSSRRNAQEDLPEVVRRLAHMSVDGIRHLSFRSSEGVQLGGWDGRISATTETPFVPQGHSAWELGTASDSRGKAQSDYDARTLDPGDAAPLDTTFVFATSRRWASKDNWATERRAEGKWKDVRALDADDLATWLESTPSVHLWLSGRIGTFPAGAKDLEYWWDVWSRATRPRLTAAFVLAGREEQTKQMQEWRKNPSHPIAIRSESRSESVAALAAAFTLLAPEDAADAMARTIVVEDESAWRGLVSARTPLILIPTFDAGDLVSAAARRGQAVVIPLGDGDADVDNSIALPPIGRDAAAVALLAAETQDNAELAAGDERARKREERARELGGLGRRSMTALRRHIGLPALLQRPTWARPDVARTVLPALFAGRWDDGSSGDRKILESLARKPYERLAEELLKYAEGADPLLRRQGTTWYLVLPEDAWDLLGRYVTDDDVERFRIVSMEVLSAPDPRFDLPADQRWMAAIHGKVSPQSGSLYRSIATTLAILGTRADAEANRTTGGQVATTKLSYVAQLVTREVLEAANADWRVWASLSDVLGELAEAAPDVFVNALETGLRGEHAQVMQLFTQEGDGLFSSSSHPGLLWALERLAWAPPYVGGAVYSLARLACLDPGGRSANRPIASLAAVFRPWMPQTSASLDRRFKILDELAHRDPNRAWEVLLSTLPKLHAIGTYSSQPRWRDWAIAERRVTRGEYNDAIAGAVERLIRLAGTDGNRWAALVEALQDLGPKEHDAVLNALENIDAASIDQTSQSVIWRSIRELVAHHRGYPTAKWAMPAERVARIDAMRERFTPQEASSKFGWLFTWHPSLPDARVSSVDDFHAYDAEVKRARVDAVRQVAEESGMPGIISLCDTIEQSQFLGEAVAESGLFTDHEVDLLRDNLAKDDKRDTFARGFAYAKQAAAGRVWVNDRISELGSTLSSAQQARLLTTLPADRETWDLASSLGGNTESAYWGLVRFVGKDEDLDFALRKLLSFGRVSVALDLMGMYVKQVHLDPHLIVKAFNGVLGGSDDAEVVSSSLGYHVSELLEYLDAQETIDKSAVARIEWNFLPLLEHSREPRVLHRTLSEDPTLFIELIKLAFRGEGEPKRAEEDITAEDHAKAQRAYALMHSWRTIPGLRDDHTVNLQKLRSWVSRARDMLVAEHRLTIGDQQIGQMLSGAPADKDGTWPCDPVRQIIEEIGSEDLETGISIGKFNSRGVVWRGRGGDQERALAEEYEGHAAAVADASHRTARMLREMAATYRRHALREDQQAALQDDLD